MRIWFAVIFRISLLASVSMANGWECRNDMEILCADGKCETKKKGEFTPMSVSFDDSGKVSVCVYTGCWEGTAKVVKNENFLILSGQYLKFSTAPNFGQNVAITLDRRDNIAVLKAGGFAQPLICKKSGSNPDTPSFGQYKVKVSEALPRPIRFRGNRNAQMFRTRLKRARKGGVNFAGSYIFTTWGCGTSCVQGAIINARTGVVYFPKELGVMTFNSLGDEDIPIQYQKDSKLFILNGTAGDNEDNESGTYYFVWQGTKFKKVKFVK